MKCHNIRKRSSLSLLLALLPLSVITTLRTPAIAQTVATPSLLSFQGRLTKPDGTPVADGNYSLRFRLYDAATGGNVLWEQTIASTAVRNGAFAALLDVGSGFQGGATEATLFNGSLFLGIKVGADAELTPRSPLTSVAYAKKADTVPDGSLTSAKFLGGVVQPGGAAGGDLTGTYPNPQIKTDASLLYKVSGTIMNASGAGVSVNVQQLQTSNEVNDSAWQSFTPTANGQLTGLDIYVGTTTGVAKTIPVVLYAGEGTTGTELLRKTVTFSPTLGFQFVDFTAPLTVTGGQKYTWFIGTSSSLKFGYATANPYAGGRADVGASLDYAFRVYMTTGASALVNVNANMVMGSAVANLAGLQIGANANRYVNLGQSGANNLLMGWIYNATAANAYGLLETFGGANPLALQTAGGNVGIGLTNPGARLEVRANRAGDTVRISGTGSNGPGYGLFNGTTEAGALGLALASGQYSTSAVAGDTILRSTSAGGKLHLQTGGAAAGITLSNNSVGINTPTPSARLDVNGTMAIRSNNTFEFGAGLTKEASAGKIGYGAFTAGALDIVGAGTTSANRAIKFWNEGGANFTGGITVPSFSDTGNAIVSGNASIGTTSSTHRLTVQSADANTLRIIGNGSIGQLGKINFGDANYVYLQEDIDDGLTISTDPTRGRLALMGGKVGIGTTTPRATLHVEGGGVSATYGSGKWLLYDSVFIREAGSNSNIVGYFAGDLVAAAGVISASSVNWSDARSKNVIGRSSGLTDLGLLDQLQITDYKWIDEHEDGGRLQKKIIAQEVEKVLPSAVRRMRKVIPNVYAKATGVQYSPATKQLTLTVAKPHDFKVGDKVDVFTERGDLIETPVLATPSASTFVIASEKGASGAFVYGKWVDDYRMVDYDAISMLNVSATQELHRQLNAKSKELEAVKAKNTELEARLNAMEAVLAELKALRQ